MTRVEQHAHARHWVFRELDRLIAQRRDAERPESKERPRELLPSKHQARGAFHQVWRVGTSRFSGTRLAER